MCHLQVCQAECCKEFSFKVNPKERLYKHKRMSFKVLDADALLYLQYHGCKVEGNAVSFRLNSYARFGDELKVYMTCEKLTKDNLCGVHETPEQPLVCRYPNKEDLGEGKVYLTPNCVYRKMKEEGHYDRTNNTSGTANTE